MSVSTLRKSLLEELDRQFRKFEFKRWSDVSGFYGDRYDRWHREIRQSVDPAISIRSRKIQFDSPYISVSLSSLESLVAKFQDRPATEVEMSARSTLGFRPDWKGFLSVFQATKVLKDEQDVIKEASRFVPWVIRKGESFWERFSDQRSILKALAEEDESSSEYSAGTSALRAIKAIALASILSGPDLALELAQKKIQDFESTRHLKTANEVRRWVNRALVAPG